MHNTSFYQTNEAINELTEEFSQIRDEVLNINARTYYYVRK